MDVQAYAKCNDNHIYILFVIDVFSKFVDMVSVKIESGPPFASAFRSIFDDSKYSIRKRRSMCVRADKC